MAQVEALRNLTALRTLRAVAERTGASPDPLDFPRLAQDGPPHLPPLLPPLVFDVDNQGGY